MKFRRAGALVMVLLLASQVLVQAAQKDGESEKFIQAAKFLEENLLDKKAKDVRRNAMTWLIATDKVAVSVCSLLLTLPGKKYKYNSDLFSQYTIGMAAFKLANPGKSNDEDAIQMAGVESALRMYEAILKSQPKEQHAFMDDLITKRGDGTLAEFVKANNCKEKK